MLRLRWIPLTRKFFVNTTSEATLNEADGSFFFALKGTAHDNPPDALLFFYQPLFLESDMAILNIYKEHQKAFRF